jgi:NAD(P)-dependent dehydrogenase (short-subunit alcohol dehydrogenase family)
MKILVIGATGTIGSAVALALEGRHEVLRASHVRSALTVDLADAESIRRLYAKVGRVDAVVSAVGQATFRPLFELSDADFALGLTNKLMGQVNLVRFGVDVLADGGSFTITTGILSRQPMPGGQPSVWSMQALKALCVRRHWSFPEACASMRSLRVGFERRSSQ